ncbi:MAG: hypothetical protein AABX17_02890 [Nanoarchaeota archaeon]
MGPKQKIKLLIVILSILFILLVGSLYLFYINLRVCENEECFNAALVKCSKVSYIKDTTTTLIQYTIKGVSENNCITNIKLLQVTKGSPELSVLEGKQMDCYTPLGVFTSPEGDITLCHGLLKEEIQNMIIKRMHAQIVENLGKINEGITKVL